MNLRKRVMAVIILVMTMSMMFGTVSAFALPITYSVVEADGGDAIRTIKVDGDLANYEFEYEENGSKTAYYVIGGEVYFKPTCKDRNDNTALREVGSTTKTKVKEAKGDKLKSDALNKIDTITSAIGAEADIEAGTELISPEMREIVATVIGALTIVILTAVGLFTALDIFYLVVPMLHQALDEAGESKGRTDKNGNVKPRFVSTDACKAYRDASENQKNVILTYLKLRLVAYIAVAIVVFLLLTGQLSAIIKFVLKLISGILTSATSL